jgi:thymidylate kinase
VIIAFMGNDGSGKTSLAGAVAERLEKAGLSIEYRRGGDHLLLARLQKLFPKETVKNSQHRFIQKDSYKSHFFRFWPYLVYLDCLVLCLSLRFLKKRKIVLMDRYFYHFIIGYEYHGYSNRLLRRLFFSLPRPDLAIVLDAPPELAYERKKTDDATPDYYQAQRQRYQDLARRIGITIISTDQPFEDSLSSAWQMVQEALPDRRKEKTS